MLRFHVRFEFSFLYSGGQLCAGVPLLEGILLLGFYCRMSVSWTGETFENKKAVSC